MRTAAGLCKKTIVVEDARTDPSGEDEADELERGLRGAPISAVLLATNVVVFAVQSVLAGSPWALVEVPNRILLLLGANASQWTIADSRFETLLTSMFLHGSILHLAMNLLVMWHVAPSLERAMGAARFLPLYLGAGIVGSATSAIAGRFGSPGIGVGASGAICGLLGALLVVSLRTQGRRGPLTKQVTAWLVVLFLVPLVVWLLKGQMGGMVQVDNAAHAGGALAGAMIATTWRRGYVYPRRATQALIAACIGLVVTSAVVVYVRDRTDPYLFMSVEERMRSGLEALREGRCDRARSAMARAVQMDPRNSAIRALADEVERECEPTQPRSAR